MASSWFSHSACSGLTKEQLGRAHHMKFSAKAGGKTLAQAAQMKLAQAAPASVQP